MVLWEHVKCGGQFWKKLGYTLNNTMGVESHRSVRQFWMGDLTLEGTME